jgi:hypothetical protein
MVSQEFLAASGASLMLDRHLMERCAHISMEMSWSPQTLVMTRRGQFGTR